MRSVFFKAAVLTASVTLVFFCSCERHHPDELPAEEHARTETSAHEHAEHVENHGIERQHSDDQQRATTALPNAAHTPTPAGTPAQFFPSATPH